MARVPETPRGVVEVVGDRDALDVRIGHAPPDAAADDRGIALLADVVVHPLASGTAIVRVRDAGDLLYAAIVVREGISEFVRLDRLPDGDVAAHVAVEADRTLHLTVVASASPAAMAELEAEVGRGGMGMGGEPEAAPPPPPPAVPEIGLGDGGFDSGPIGGGGLGGRSPGLAPAPDLLPPPDAVALPDDGDGAPADGDDLPADGHDAPVAASPGPAEGLAGAAPVPAFVDAEIPSRIVAGVAFDAVVRLSLTELAPTPGTSRRRTRARFDPSRDIEVSVQLRGLAPAGGAPSVVTTTLPASGEEPRRLVFRLVPDAPGRGHITVTFTQSPVVTPLAVLALSAPILPADEADDAGVGDPHVVAASVAVPPREIADLPTLAIDESLSHGTSELHITAKVGRTVKRHVATLEDKAGYVEEIYAELARIRDAFEHEAEDDPDEAAETVRREVRSLGARIAGRLLGDDINALLWSRRKKIAQLVLQTSGELDIPWEIVHLVPVDPQRPDPERYFLGDLGLTRWMYGTQRPTVIPLDASRVVAIAPEYVNPDYDLPRAREEITTIGALLSSTPRSADDPGALREIITGGFDLLHFAGHGRWRDAAPLGQEIAFAAWSEDAADGSASYTDSDARRDLPELSDVVAAATAGGAEGSGGRPPAPFVFLSACDVGRLRSGATGLGGFAEVFLRGGVGVFIGCSWAVRDDVSAAFVRTFYEHALGQGEPLGEAVLAARHAARDAGDLTSLAFTVFADPRARLVPR